MNFSSQHSKHAKAINALGLNATFIGLAYAAIETIWSIYIFSFFPNESTVGYVSAIFSLAALASLLFTFPLFERFSPKELLFTAVGANAIILALFAHISNPTLFIILGIVNALIMGVRVQSFGILIRHNSSRKEINHDENHIYLLANIGWILGPLFGGYIADIIDIRSVMILGSVALLFSVYTITYNQNTFKKEKITHNPDHINILKNITQYFRNKKRFLSYCLSGGLEVWWSLPYIFIPVIMIERYHFSVGDVGIFLFLTVIPVTLVEYIMQKKEPKNLRKIIGKGYLFVTIIALIAGLSGNIYVILGAFIVGSFGVGLIEPTVESYFFSITKENESKKYYGSFMTAKTLGSFLGKMVIASILLYFPIQIAILTIGFFVFILSMWSLKGK